MLKISGAKPPRKVLSKWDEIGQRAAKMGAIAAGDSDIYPEP